MPNSSEDILELDWLYDIQSSDLITYNSAGRGQLVPERALLGHTKIYKTCGKSNRIKKTLVFCDPLSLYAFDDEVIKCLSILAKAGFKIYSPDDTNQFELNIPSELTTFSLFYLTQEEIKLSHPELSKTAASELCFLRHSEIQKIIGRTFCEKTPTIELKTLYDLIKIKKYPFRLINLYFKNHYNEELSIIHSNISNDSLGMWEELLKNDISEEYLKAIKYIISPTVVTVKKDFEKIKDYINNIITKPNPLKNKVKIVFIQKKHTHFNTSEIIDFLKRFFTISEVEFVNSIPVIEWDKIEDVHKVTLCRSKNILSDLKCISENKKDTEDLIIESNQINSDEIHLNNYLNKFKNLRNFSCISIKRPILLDLTENEMPKLENLELYNSNFKQLILPNSIDGNKWRIFSKHSFWTGASVNYISRNSNGFSKLENQKAMIESLDLETTTLSDENIIHHINSLTKLSKLYIREKIGCEDLKNLNPNILSNIERYCHVFYFNKSQKVEIKVPFKNLKNLKVIVHVENEDDEENEDYEDDFYKKEKVEIEFNENMARSNLKNLEVLSIESDFGNQDIVIKTPCLYGFLKYLKNLKYLKINNVKEMNEKLSLIDQLKMISELELNNLEILDISESEILLNQNVISAFLDKTPNLKELQIDYRSSINTPELVEKLKYLKVLIIGKNDEQFDLSNIEKEISNISIIKSYKINENNLNTIGENIDINTRVKEIEYENVGINFQDQKGENTDPSCYRNSIFNMVEVCSEKVGIESSPFSVHFYGSLNIITLKEKPIYAHFSKNKFYKLSDSENSQFFIGQKNIILSNTWVGLPSLNVNESLYSFFIEDLKEYQFLLGYSNAQRKYFIKLSNNADNKQYKMQMVIKVPQTIIGSDPKIVHITSKYINGGDSLASENYYDANQNQIKRTGSEWLELLINKGAGSCRHKAIACLSELQKNGYEAHFVSNDLHAFIEVLNKNHWTSYHLGGHPVSIKNYLTSFTDEQDERREDSVIEPNNPEEPILDCINNLLPFYTSYSHFKAEDNKNKKPLNPAFSDQTITENFERIDDLLSKLRENYIGKNVLLNFKDNGKTDDLMHALRKQTQLYYIDDAEELYCYYRNIARTEESKVLSGPKTLGGPLYEFLTRLNQIPILLINYLRFSHEDLVKVHEMIDKIRSIQGVRIPENAILVGLCNDFSLINHFEDDFLLRNKIITLNLQLESSTLLPLASDFSNSANEILVNLHKSENWQRLLLGKYDFTTEGIYFKEGPLIDALSGKGKTLVLSDPPLSQRDFVLLLYQLKIDKQITIAGKLYKVPENFSIVMGKSYSLEHHVENRITVQYIQGNNLVPEQAITLNPITFNDFFVRYPLHQKPFCGKKGWITECCEGSTLTVYLSDNISNDQWGELIEAAEKVGQQGIKLKILTRTDVNLPAAIKKQIIDTTPPPATRFFDLNVIETARAYEYIKKCIFTDRYIIDCSALSPCDLFGKLTPAEEDSNFKFNITNGLVIDILSNNIKVALVGSFSSEMVQYLCSLTNKAIKNLHLLTVITSTPFPSLKPITYNYHQDNSTLNAKKQSNEYIETNSNDCMKARCDLMCEALQKCSIVLLEGPTGVGKTYFMLQEFARRTGKTVHTNIESWLKSSGLNDQILYIDEANISDDEKHEWTEFASLLNNTPPSIIYKGIIHTLGSNFKVVFSGNQASYGGERHVPALFDNYPIPKVVFKPLLFKFLHDNIIVPMLSQFPELNSISNEFEKVYQQVLTLANGEPLITPREVEQMAYLYQIHYQNNCDSKKLAYQAAYTVAHQVLPRTLQAEFLSPIEKLSRKTQSPCSDYLITPSRHHLESRLNELIDIRNIKMSQMSPKIGLSGLLIEGPPGIGKSDHVIAQLKARGLQEKVDFIHISVNLGYSEKKALLLDAYKNGKIVIIDELNSTSAMERLLNDLLSGTLKIEGQIKRGFTLIATQNPITMHGRRALSPALMRRFFKCELNHHDNCELIDILNGVYKVPRLLALELCKDFEEANQQRKNPMGVRGLINNLDEAVQFIKKTGEARHSEVLEQAEEYLNRMTKSNLDFKRIRLITTN